MIGAAKLKDFSMGWFSLRSRFFSFNKFQCEQGAWPRNEEYW